MWQSFSSRKAKSSFQGPIHCPAASNYVSEHPLQATYDYWEYSRGALYLTKKMVYRFNSSAAFKTKAKTNTWITA